MEETLEELGDGDYVDWYGETYQIISIDGDLCKIEPIDRDDFSFSGERERFAYKNELTLVDESEIENPYWSV